MKAPLATEKNESDKPEASSYSYVPLERISWGRPAAELAGDEMRRLGAERILVVASNSLATSSDVVEDVCDRLTEFHVSVFHRCIQHVPLESVKELLDVARDVEPDIILTIGGGTPIDTAKLVQFALARSLHSIDEIVAQRGVTSSLRSPVRQVIIPTTLSGSEYTNVGGATDNARKMKDSYPGVDLCAVSVILDPAISTHTPDWLWFSTGVRALDHAVESYLSSAPLPYVDATALPAIKMFAEALARTKVDPDDQEARLRSLQAVGLATTGLARVPMGASHGISYALGVGAGVPHGYTSCVLLPAVMRYNEPATSQRQADIATALGRPGENAADSVREFLANLGLPTTLRELGVSKEMLSDIAERAMAIPQTRTNPRPINETSQVMEILSSAL